jgi:hypothetical protein
MRASDELFQLIKSMSASEKGYFKKNTQFGESRKQNNYLKLFDAIEDQARKAEAKYDETEVRKRFRGQTFINQLNNTKRYLHSLILKSLRDYHKSKSVNLRSRNDLDEIEILIQKGLFDQAQKKVEQLKIHADRYEDILTSITLRNYEESILNRIQITRNRPHDWENLFQEKKELINKVLYNNEYRSLERALLIINGKVGLTREAKVMDELREFARNPLLENDSKANSFDSKFRFNQINAIIQLHLLDYEKQAQFFKKNIELIEANPFLLEAFYKEYYPVALHNYINARILGKSFDDVPEYIEKLKVSSGDTKAQQARVFYFAAHDESAYCIHTGSFKKGLELVPEIEHNLSELATVINPDHQVILNYNLAVLFFGNEEFEKSDLWLDKITRQGHHVASEDVQSFARILQILNHYELGNIMFLTHLVSTAQRFFKKKKYLFEYEKTILLFFKKAINLRSKLELKPLCISTKEKLIDTFDNPLEKNSLHLFDFISWLDSKIERMTYREVIRRSVE